MPSGKNSYGKSWGKLTKQPGTEYQQVSSGGESHSGSPSGKFLPGGRSKEYATNTSGESHGGSPSGKFLGATKGNGDLPPKRS